jgi:glyceraldehyde-3-phosphate dehydrogenase/erythrose-4-phosphate dehydrogenase
MLYQKVKKYLSDNLINIEKVENYIEFRNDGAGDYIASWDALKVGVPQPTDLQINAISEADALKQSIIPSIKSEASKRIVAAYPEWKQRNHMAAVVDIQNKELIALKANTTYTLSADELAIVAAAQAAKTEIFNIRAKSDELEASLDTMTQEQLETFDATNDSNWV